MDVEAVGKRYRVDADKCNRQTLREIAHQAGFKLFMEESGTTVWNGYVTPVQGKWKI
ncbi:hypothetical protein [Desmospora profundinema]|uniref:Uncharacterized protein n=1 Tax=Desmospora profundinema TaxID=1571184 RepID=A0ABU1INL6_9BACL|nr:hypothetical protein [Desmospora profundinema]MDR6226384.1 hypothetical protein [Desmospora profundinema]